MFPSHPLVLSLLPHLPRSTERLLLKEWGSVLRGVEVLELHGSMAPGDQDRIVGARRGRSGRPEQR